jgi:hypothetical protein
MKIGKKSATTSLRKWVPTSEVPQVYQNGFGARWEYDQGFWVKDNIVVCAGIQVLAGIEKAFGPGPATEGIQITITDARTHAATITTAVTTKATQQRSGIEERISVKECITETRPLKSGTQRIAARVHSAMITEVLCRCDREGGKAPLSNYPI